MKLAILAATAAAMIAGSAHADPAADALSARAEACIRNAAPKVSSIAHSLTDAVNFLVDDLCVVQVQHAESYATSLRTLADWRGTTASSQLESVTIDPNTGELKTPPSFSPPFNPSSVLLTALKNAGGPRSHFRVVAAETVLAASTSAKR